MSKRGGALALLLVAAIGCGGEGKTDGATSATSGGGGSGGAASPCPPGERVLEGACLPPGVQRSGCPAGTRLVDGVCQLAGIPAGACGPGFTHDGDVRCEVVLPAEPCAAGTRAVPGDVACRGFDTCGSAPYPAVPAGRTLIHVDAGYAPGNGDGSAAQPFRTLGEGVAAASAGDVVVVAAGTYDESVVVQDQPVTIWGRCPSMVSVSPTTNPPGSPAFTVGAGADGTVVRGLAITGDGTGIVIIDVEAVTLEDLWIHDLSGHGLDILFETSAAAATLREVLIERATERGVYAEGSQVMLERCVVRDTALAPGGSTARAVNIRDDVETGEPGAGMIESSVLEGGNELGLMVHASTFLVDDSLVRGVAPAPDGRFGRCANVQVGASSVAPASLTMVRSAIRHCHDGGIVASGAEIVVEATMIGDVEASEAESFRGYGLVAQHPPAVDSRAQLTVVDSVIERTHEVGVFVAGSDVEATGLLVEHTRHVTPSDPSLPELLGGRAFEVQRDHLEVADATGALLGCRFTSNEEAGLVVNGGVVVAEGIAIEDTTPLGDFFGRGVVVQPDVSGVGGDVVVDSSIVVEATEVGVFVQGSSAVLDGVLIENTRARPDGALGVGLDVELAVAAGLRGSAALVDSRIDGAVTSAVTAYGADVTVTHSHVTTVAPSESFGDFGDGIAITNFPDVPTAHVVDSLIEGVARAGFTSFGGSASMAATRIECAPIDLAGELWATVEPSFEDAGNNRCGCLAEARICKVLSASLTPPEPPMQL